jgi:hypothetical protein
VWPQLLLVSDDSRERRLAQQVALAGSLALQEALDRESVRKRLVSNPQTLVLWDAANPEKYQRIGEVFPKYVRAERVFALTDQPLTSYPHLASEPAWGSHLLRRFPDPAIHAFVRLLHAALSPEPRTLERFFPRETVPTRITLKRSTHKHAAIEAIQNHLQKRGIRGRMAALIAQATDELILNAVFDAPRDENRSPFRYALSRDSDFELNEREQVEVELASTEGYLGVSVTDRFGSLDRATVLESLLQRRVKVGEGDEDGHLGLAKVLQSGLSLAFTGKRGECTRAMLFCPEAENYRAFRAGFHFLGVLID